MEIGEMLRQALAKLVRREAGDQAKTTCGNLKLCAGLEAGIEGATHVMGQRRLERKRKRQNKEEARRPSEEEGGDEVTGAERLTVEIERTEE